MKVAEPCFDSDPACIEACPVAYVNFCELCCFADGHAPVTLPECSDCLDCLLACAAPAFSARSDGPWNATPLNGRTRNHLH